MVQNDGNLINVNNEIKILPRAAVIQDMSGFGKVSLTEAIPVMSAMGVEVCPLPTAILSTHTYEFKDYTLCDLTDEMPKIINHWKQLGIQFDGVYSGYMSSKRQIEITKTFMTEQREKGAKTIVDPVMGDNALLNVQVVYSERMRNMVGGMRELCAVADVITPNLTEACILTGTEYPKGAIDDEVVKEILQKLMKLGCSAAVITSVMDSDSSMCVAVCDGAEFHKIDCGYVDRLFHGTGDIFTSVLTGGLLLGKTVLESTKLATDFVCEAIKETIKYPQIPIRHGVLFEEVLRKGFFTNKG